MLKTLPCVLALLVMAPAAGAQDKTKDTEAKKPASAAEEYKTLTTEYNLARQKLIAEYRAAPAGEEKTKKLAEVFGVGGKFAARFVALAKKDLKDTVAFDSLGWVVRYVRGGDEVGTAFELLQKHFLDNPKISTFLQAAVRSTSEQARPFLAAVLENNKQKSLHAQACFALASHLKRRGERGGGAKVVAESEKYFQRVVDEFADVRGGRGTLGLQAKAELADINGPRGIGKVAPEIEAEDLDGVTFKLSDYRGKVVVIDFWGNW